MRDFFLALASLLIAVVLWLQIQPQSVPGREREMSVRLDVENLPAGLAVIQAPESVKVIVSGTAQALEQLDSSEFSAAIDLKDSSVGEVTTLVQVKGPTRSSITARAARPRITLLVDRISRTTKGVSIESTGLPPSGFTYDSSALEPEEIELTGPTRLVQKVAVVRAILDLSKVRPGSSFTLSLEPMDAQGRPVTGLTLEPSEVTATPGVNSAPALKRVFVNAVFNGQLPFGATVERYQVIPPQVEITGPSSEIAGITSLNTEAISLDGMTGNIEREVNLIVPQNIRVSGSIRVKALLVIKEAAPQPPSGNSP